MKTDSEIENEELKKSEPWGWFIMFAVATYAGSIITPQILEFPAWVGAIFGLTIMVGLKFLDTVYFKKENDKKV